MCPFQSCDFCVLIPLIWDLYEAEILGGDNDCIFIFISLAIETPILSEYIPENIYVLFYLLIAKFKKAKILPSWFLTASAKDTAISYLKLWPDQSSPLSFQYK